MGLNLGEFFRQQIIKWNKDDKCGFCWEFDLPLRESDANESLIKTEECCVRVMITDLVIQENKTTNSAGLVTAYSEDYQFILNVVIPSEIDKNVYHEQIHPISESKWETILNPLKECLSGDRLFDFCDILGRDIIITNRRWTSRIDWLDNNYDGWSIAMTLRIDDRPYNITPQ